MRVSRDCVSRLQWHSQEAFTGLVVSGLLWNLILSKFLSHRVLCSPNLPSCLFSSVERVVEYLDLPQEPPAVIESNRPPAYWPSSSNQQSLLEVEDLVVKYAPELPAVLHGVSFGVKARERIGLLGRTGSGKSTLAMSLLRFVSLFPI